MGRGCPRAGGHRVSRRARRGRHSLYLQAVPHLILLHTVLQKGDCRHSPGRHAPSGSRTTRTLQDATHLAGWHARYAAHLPGCHAPRMSRTPMPCFWRQALMAMNACRKWHENSWPRAAPGRRDGAREAGVKRARAFAEFYFPRGLSGFTRSPRL